MTRRLRPACLLLPVLGALGTGCGDSGPARIRLAEGATARGGQTASSVLRVDPKPKHTLAIHRFDNETGDSSLDWLRRGVADMLATELGQSSYLTVLGPARMEALLGSEGDSPRALIDTPRALQAARQAGVETTLGGRLRKDEAGLVIEAELRNLATGQVVRREQVRGSGLERVFLMASELTRRFRDQLPGDLEDARARSLAVGEMTGSIEAFRHYSRALEYHEKMLIAEANRELESAVEADPSFAAAYVYLAGTRSRLGDREGFFQALEKARELGSRLTEANQLRLRLYLANQAGDADQIRATRDELWRRAPQDLELRALAAGMLFETREYDRALEECELLLDEDPEREMALNLASYLYAMRGDYGTALRYLERYRALTPDEPNAYDSTGEVLMMAGRLGEAAQQLKQALAKWPDFTHSARLLMEIYAELGDRDQALAYGDHWIETAVNDKERLDAELGKAALRWRFGDVAGAREIAERARAAAPAASAFRASRFLALLEQAGGEPEASRRIYREAILDFADAIETGRTSALELGSLPGMALVSELPPRELLPVLERLEGKARSGSMRNHFQLVRALLRLREPGPAGASQGALPFRGPAAQVLEYLVEGRQIERSRMWKYLIEAVTLEPRYDPPRFAVLEALQPAIERSGRTDVATLGRLLEAQYRAKYGDAAASARAYAELGVPREESWQVVGPFPNRPGFLEAYPPEAGVKLADRYRSGGRELRWKPAADGLSDGYVDLEAVLSPSEWAVGYAAIHIDSPSERVVQLRLGTDEDCKLWLNEELVWQSYHMMCKEASYGKEPTPIDQDIIQVVLRRGLNRVLLKITNSVEDWGFYFRVTDFQGNGFPDLRFAAPAG